jgi:2-hydroxychromene-2-carboxylate isomerase
MTADASARFFFDLASPEAYLAAERVIQVMPVATEWVPILDPGPAFGHFRCAEEQTIMLGELERIAAARGMQAFRWPELPWDSTYAMLVATYAKQTGRTVQFAQAAFRQAYAGGWDLSDPDRVLIAASACEMHPRAILKAVETKLVRTALDRATADAVERGVRSTPAVWTGDRVFHGDAGLEDAAAVLAEHAP